MEFSTCSWLDHSASGLFFMTFESFLQTVQLLSYLRLLIKIKLAIKKKLLAHYAKGTLSLLRKLQLIVCIEF